MYSQASRSTSSVSDSTKYEPASGIGRVDHPGLGGDDLLRPQRQPGGFLGRQRQRLVVAVGVQALRPAEHRGQRLERDPNDVVERLLGGERRPTGLGVEAQHRAARILGTEALGHDPVPHPPAGPELGDLLEEVVVPVPEERQPWAEVVDVHAGVDRSLHVGDRVGERERDLLHRGRARLTDVVAGDRDRVPLRDVLGAVLEDVGDDPHRRPRRVHVGAAGDVLLEQIVLDRARDLIAADTLLLGDELVEQQQDRRRRVDRHRRRHLVERDVGQQQSACRRSSRSPRPPCRPRPRRAGDRSRDPSGSAGRTRTTARSGRRASRNLKRWLVDSAVPKPAYWRIVHGRPRYIDGYTPRVNGASPGRRAARPDPTPRDRRRCRAP